MAQFAGAFWFGELMIGVDGQGCGRIHIEIGDGGGFEDTFRLSQCPIVGEKRGTSPAANNAPCPIYYLNAMLLYIRNLLRSDALLPKDWDYEYGV